MKNLFLINSCWKGYAKDKIKNCKFFTPFSRCENCKCKG